jgi:hypothetical protein
MCVAGSAGVSDDFPVESVAEAVGDDVALGFEVEPELGVVAK